MKWFTFVVIYCRHCSLLRTAKAFLYGFVPFIFVLTIILFLSGCVYIDWEYGNLPKLKVDTSWCDDMDLNASSDLDKFEIECEWEFDL